MTTRTRIRVAHVPKLDPDFSTPTSEPPAHHGSPWRQVYEGRAASFGGRPRHDLMTLRLCEATSHISVTFRRRGTGGAGSVSPHRDSHRRLLIDAIRDALAARGLTTMAERQQAIEAVAGRSVESLRSLTRAEALHVLSELSPTSALREPGDASASWRPGQIGA